MSKALILANGDLPLRSNIKYLIKKGYGTLICADGGSNHAKRLNLIPDLIIGDLDSITEQNKEYFRNKSHIISYKRQNDTDVEKSLKYLIKKKFEEVILLGGTGDRLDHTICNLGIILKYYEKIKVSLLHKNSFLKPLTGIIEIQTVKEEIISIYGFDKKTKITSRGLKYSLNNVALPFGEKESTSNVATSNKITLNIENGIIFLVRDFRLLKKYDLF